GEYGGDRFQLVKESIDFTRTKQKVRRLRGDQMVEEQVEIVLPLVRLIWKKEIVNDPIIVDGYEHVDAETGEVRYLTAEEYKEATGTDVADAEKMAKVVKVKIVRSQPVEREVVVGVFNEGKRLKEGERAEDWAQARERAEADGATVETREVLRYVNRFRNEQVIKDDNRDFEGTGPTAAEFEETDRQDNGLDDTKAFQTYSRWTVPPPMVYCEDSGEWQVITRLADKIGPANRWDGTDAPRFLTRYVSEMWGVAIFRGVKRDWDYANVYVRGLRGQVSNAGLEI